MRHICRYLSRIAGVVEGVTERPRLALSLSRCVCVGRRSRRRQEEGGGGRQEEEAGGRGTRFIQSLVQEEEGGLNMAWTERCR